MLFSNFSSPPTSQHLQIGLAKAHYNVGKCTLFFERKFEQLEVLKHQGTGEKKKEKKQI